LVTVEGPTGKIPSGTRRSDQSLVRSKAREWDINPKHIGMVGFSAGGHLAIATATNFDKRTSKPTSPADQSGSPTRTNAAQK
jgi:acetyl esterase/lipase